MDSRLTLVDYAGYRWTLRDDGMWVSDVGTVRDRPVMTPPNSGNQSFENEKGEVQ